MNTKTPRPLGAGVALGAAVLALAAAGCTSGAIGHTAGGSRSAPGRTVLTGSRLNAMLLPASAMPPGMRMETDTARNTGEGVMPPSSAPVEPGKLCGTLLQTSWIRAAGIGSATFAQNDYVDSGHINQFAQEIDVFHRGEAPRVMAGLRKTFTRCRSFTDRSGGMTARVRLVPAALRGTGDEAVKATVTSPAWTGGMTLVAIRQGDAVVTAFYSSSHHDKGAAAVTMARTIAGKVGAAT